MNLDKIKKEIALLAENTNFILYKIEYVNESNTNILRVTVDRKEAIDIEDITVLTDKINEYLDKNDPIQEEYSLEVTSRGVEKELSFDEIKDNIGKYVFIKTSDQGFYGELFSIDGANITIKAKNKKIGINYNDCQLIRLAVKF